MQNTPNKYQGRLNFLVKVYAVVTVVGGLASRLFSQSTLTKFLSPFKYFAIGGGIFFIFAFLVVGIEYLGQSNGKDTFASQSKSVLANLAKWMFIPALVITALILAFAWWFSSHK